MAQQTAVEFLIESIDADARGLWTKELRKKAEQANKKFEEQVKEAFDNGDHCIDLPDGGWEQKYKSADHYYNETFGNNQNK